MLPGSRETSVELRIAIAFVETDTIISTKVKDQTTAKFSPVQKNRELRNSLKNQKRQRLGYNSIFRYKRPKRAVGALQVLHFYTSSERVARVASCIEPYSSLQIHANPSWLTVYRYRKCAITQLQSTVVNTTILT